MVEQEVKAQVEELTKQDFVSDQMVKWCAGCGAHAILNSVEKVFPQLGKRKEDFCLISGIGCSSRFPYYVNTYGIHGIHGRAAIIASGVKSANPDLSVWVATGDGDSMAIGGNHFIHVLRRNIDLNILLFNNKIYGLTKGQYSPTTPQGGVTKTSPYGTIEKPFNPGELVLGAGGTFFARVTDKTPKLMTEVMLEAAKHKGTAIIEILQNCVIFNDDVHHQITSKETRADNQLLLVDGEPMIFGKNKDMGITYDGNNLNVVKIGENGITEKDIMIHKPAEYGLGMRMLLAHMMPAAFPAAIGVLWKEDAPVYDQEMEKQIEYVQEKSEIKSMDDLLRSGNTWEIK